MHREKKIPITVGIIGHLDAIVTEEHKFKIVELFDDIHANYPNSPLYLFSQLAKGADTAVAELFIEIKTKTKRHYELITPLPYDKDKYEAHFDEADKIVFNRLLDKSNKSFVLNSYDEQHLDHLYREGGKFVADSSIILLALVENGAANKTGGTADLVNYKTNGTFNADGVDGLFDMRGMVIELDCGRTSSEVKRELRIIQEPLMEIIKGPGNKNIAKALQQIDELNRLVPDPLLSKSEMELYPRIKGLLPEHLLLRGFYAITNTGAEKHQKTNTWVFRLLFLIGPITIVVFEKYKEPNHNPFFLIATVSLIVFSIVLYLYNDNKKNHPKFLEKRIIAEALRIQFFWSVSGINENISKHILRIHNTEYNWIKYLLSAIYGVCYTNGNAQIPTADVVTHWIKDQFYFFESRIKKLNQRIEFYKYLFLMLLIPGIMLIFFLYWACQKEPLILLIGLLISFAASAKAYSEKKGFHQIINQYELMKSIYAKSADKIEHIMAMNLGPQEKEAAIKKIYLLAGKEALIENGNWYLIFKEKEPEVQIGG